MPRTLPLMPPLTDSPTATWVESGTLITGLPLMVAVATFPVWEPIIASLRPTLVNDLIPKLTLAAVVYAVVLAVATGEVDGVAPVEVGLPEAMTGPIAKPAAEATVIWFDPGVIRVVVI